MPMQMKHLVLAAGMLAMAMMSACGRPAYRGTVTAFARGADQPAGAFVLMPADPAVDPHELEFEGYARLITRVLEQAGFAQASSPTESDLVITLGYSLAEPVGEQLNLSAPIYGPVGPATSTTYGNVNPVPGGAAYTATTYTSQPVGVVGYSPASLTIYTQRSSVELRAYRADAAERSESSEVWRVTSASEMLSADLRTLFPFHVLALRPYLGRSTPEGAVPVSIPLKDPRVAALRAGGVP
jgi:hypothetical protein